MSTFAIVGLGLLLAVAVGWSAYDFLASAQRFIAPDIADHDAINAERGAGTPEARAALEKRFGQRSHWRDAATGLSGLAGLLLLLWLWFG